MLFVILFSSSIVPQRKLTSLFFPFFADFQQERLVPHVWSLFVVFTCCCGPFRYSWVVLGSFCVHIHRALPSTGSSVSSLIARGKVGGGVLLTGGTGTISQRPELWSAHLVWAQASLRVLPQCPAWPIILGYRASAEKPSPTALLRIRCLETKHCRILEVNTWALWYFTEITDYVRFLLLFLRLYQQKSHENRFYMPSSLPQ